MAQVICKLPNASEEISGVKFTAHDGGMLSEEISDEQAARFASIPGYALVGAKPAQAPAEPAVDSELATLAARAAELGVQADPRWKAARLKAEIDKAERAAQAPADPV
jgi:hypothetical protein